MMKAPARLRYLRVKLIVSSTTSFRSSRTGKNFRIRPAPCFNRFDRKNGPWAYARETTSSDGRSMSSLPILKAAEVLKRSETSIWAKTKKRSNSLESHFIFEIYNESQLAYRAGLLPDCHVVVAGTAFRSSMWRRTAGTEPERRAAPVPGRESEEAGASRHL